MWITGASSGHRRSAHRAARRARRARRDLARGARSACGDRGDVAGARRGRPRLSARRHRSGGGAANGRRDRAGVRRDRPRDPERGQPPARRERAIFDGQQFADNMAVNYLGVVYGIDAVLPGMLLAGRGHIAGRRQRRRVPRGARRRRPTARRRRRSSTCWIRSASSSSRAGITVTVVNPGLREDAAHRSKPLPDAVPDAGRPRRRGAGQGASRQAGARSTSRRSSPGR